MTKYLRFRKEEARTPKFGPWLVIRWWNYNEDFWTRRKLPYMQYGRTIEVGLYFGERFNLMFRYSAAWKRRNPSGHNDQV